MTTTVINFNCDERLLQTMRCTGATANQTPAMDRLGPGRHIADVRMFLAAWLLFVRIAASGGGRRIHVNYRRLHVGTPCEGLDQRQKNYLT